MDFFHLLSEDQVKWKLKILNPVYQAQMLSINKKMWLYKLVCILKHHIQSNLEKDEQSWRTHTSWIQNLLQSCSDQSSVVLA